MSDSYVKDRARLHIIHKWAWVTLILVIAGTATLSWAWGEGHMQNVLALWWADFWVWAGAPGINTKIGATIAPAGIVLDSLAADPTHPFWQAVLLHSHQLLGILAGAPALAAALLAGFSTWRKKLKGDEVEVKRGAEILDAKALKKLIEKQIKQEKNHD